MKGLLRKDLWMMWSVCRMNLLFILGYLAVGFVTGHRFFLYFPCMLAAMIPMALLSGDEQCQWDSYAAALPCSAGELVGSKYLLGAAMRLVALVLVLLLLLLRGDAMGFATAGEMLCLGVSLLFVSTLSSTLTLPWMFRFGVEKGRVCYFVLMGMCFGGMTILSKWQDDGRFLHFSTPRLAGILLLAIVALDVGSYFLAKRGYRKRRQQG